MEQGGKAQRETPPPPQRPSASPRGCVVPTTCLRSACNGGEAKRAPLPPPPTPPPPRGRMRVGRGRKAPPPQEGNAAGWGGRGRRVRDEPHDRARRGRAPCKPRRGDHRGCGRRIEGATKGAARQTPPPCRGTGATPRACDARATEGKRQAPPPPHASAPPRVGVAGREGRAAAPPLQRGGHRGSARSVGRAKTWATRRAPHPSRRTSAVPRASAVPATCLRRRKGNDGPPPPPAPTSHTHQGQRRGQRGEGEGARGMTVAGGGPPPRGHRGRVGRQRDETTVPKGSTRRASPHGGTAGGATAGRVG